MRALYRPACALSGRSFRKAWIGVAPIAAIFLSAPALAETSLVHGLCAAHGPDYVEVAGSGRCVRIGGHVRAAMVQTPPSAPAAAGSPVGVIADGVNHVARTLQGATDFSQPRLYQR